MVDGAWAEAVVTDFAPAAGGHTLTFNYGMTGQERTEVLDLYKAGPGEVEVTEEVRKRVGSVNLGCLPLATTPSRVLPRRPRAIGPARSCLPALPGVS